MDSNYLDFSTPQLGNKLGEHGIDVVCINQAMLLTYILQRIFYLYPDFLLEFSGLLTRKGLESLH